MTEKEMVEEMAKAIRPVLTSRVDIVHIPDLDKPIAEELLKRYQPKIPEGAVVLTKEEWEKYQITQMDWNAIYYEGIDKARKETAREIIQLLDGHQFEDDGWTWSVSKRDLKFIAKKYGVEIEGGNKND